MVGVLGLCDGEGRFNGVVVLCYSSMFSSICMNRPT
jgi:hypothetical protein